MIADDDEIDAMLVSLSTRCYELLARQSPVASDLRLVVSVLRILTEFERIGDLCLRIANLAPQQPLVASDPEIFDILQAMADEATRALPRCGGGMVRPGRDPGGDAGRAGTMPSTRTTPVSPRPSWRSPAPMPCPVPWLRSRSAGRSSASPTTPCSSVSGCSYLLTGDTQFLTEEAR